MLLNLYVKARTNLDNLIKNQRGEGMVGWIVAVLLTVAIVMVIYLGMTDWLDDFMGKLQSRLDSIV